ncbi:MAG: ParB/RepB/Spo0J family partition protein [Syntrophomonadaceae bacterium]|nr:ParB/RepB/Spo0J family partition protein [Syntrophomonadaceae bacterium]
MSKRVLGKGLDALFSSGESLGEPGNEISLEEIVVRDNQPRQVFNDETIKEMADSIRQHGVLQPLLVRPLDNGKYELVAGERRLRAAVLAGLKKVPVVIREMEEPETWEAALIENLQRENLNPVDEAAAYREMMDRFGYTQEELARKIGKSRAYVANTVRLLNLPAEVKELVKTGQLTAGHARAILALKETEQQVALAQKIIQQGMTVRDTEDAGARERTTSKGDGKKKDPNLLMVEHKFEELLNTRVKVIKQKKGGKIEVHFNDDEELNRIMEVLGLL